MEYFYLNIFLTETTKNRGQLEIVNRDATIKSLLLTSFTLTQNTAQGRIATNNQSSNPRTITFTALTKSRLDEVKTYDLNNPFKLNVNGVTKIERDATTNDIIYVDYNIEGITYRTFISNNLTYYTVTKPTDEFDTQRLINNSNSVFVDIKKTLNAMIIERSNVSVYNYFNKINNCQELDDILDIF
jgi:hypothetical protein